MDSETYIGDAKAVAESLDDFDEDDLTSSLTEAQAQNVLQRAFDKHDASEGITWESLRYWSEEELCN